MTCTATDAWLAGATNSYKCLQMYSYIKLHTAAYSYIKLPTATKKQNGDLHTATKRLRRRQGATNSYKKRRYNSYKYLHLHSYNKLRIATSSYKKLQTATTGDLHIATKRLRRRRGPTNSYKERRYNSYKCIATTATNSYIHLQTGQALTAMKTYKKRVPLRLSILLGKRS